MTICHTITQVFWQVTPKFWVDIFRGFGKPSRFHLQRKLVKIGDFVLVLFDDLILLF